ncbi:hypothetical protein Godav_025646, partial [Gossypium davidsonii]|nr:hypothetical protein [Gossypium davidsonii]
DFTRIVVTQNSLQELKEIWDQWNDEFWNLAYSCFTFGKVDLVYRIEEYIALLRCSKIQVDRAYSGAVNVLTFLKKLMNITGISEHLKDLSLAHPDTKEEGRCLCFKYIRLSGLPQSFGTR